MFASQQRLASLRDRPNHWLVAEYARLDALEARVRARRLLVLAVLDERGLDPGCSAGAGALGTPGWVAAQSRTREATARADVRAARGLRDLPAVADTALAGRLSRDQIDSVVRLATPETDARWAADAPRLSAQELARQARAHEVVTREQAAARQAPARLWWRARRHLGRVQLCGDFADVDGARVVRALERTAEKLGPRADGTWAPYEERLADAFVSICSQTLAVDGDPDRALIVVHAPVEAFRAAQSPGIDLADVGLSIAAETLRRLACDCAFQWIAHAPEGQPIGVGRRSRRIPRWLDRLVRHRDQHCRYPGCERVRGAEVHHIVHWAHGGETHIANLVLLCPRHHALVHEHRWTIRGNPSVPGELVFVPPDGREHPPGRGTGPPGPAARRAQEPRLATAA